MRPPQKEKDIEEFSRKFKALGIRHDTCRESDIRVLEFHHIEEKESTISYMVGEGYSVERIQKELDKTQVLCANCHRKLTMDERKWWRGKRKL